MATVTWEDLSLEQKQIAIDQYISIREQEEGRAWNDIISNPDYDEPIDWSFVKCCTFILTEKATPDKPNLIVNI